MIRKLIHEIRNPLNSMSLHLQLLAEDLEIQIPSDHTNDLTRVQRIQDEIQRLDQLLSSFQRYANLPPLQFEVVDLKRVIEDVIDFNAPEAILQGIEVNCQIEDLPPISLDVDQIKQAILNLVLNANQSMDKGGKLHIRVILLGTLVQIEIEDTGVGIAPFYQDRIFDLFFPQNIMEQALAWFSRKKLSKGMEGKSKLRVNSIRVQRLSFTFQLI